jgi:hypothetical protein
LNCPVWSEPVQHHEPRKHFEGLSRHGKVQV